MRAPQWFLQLRGVQTPAETCWQRRKLTVIPGTSPEGAGLVPARGSSGGRESLGPLLPGEESAQLVVPAERGL